MKQLILSLFLLFAFATLPAQRIADTLSEMPENIIPILTEEGKRALLEDSTITTVTTLLGEVTRVEHRDDYIMFRTSAVGTTQIKLLNTEQDEELICVVQTVCAPACNSDIAFYNSDWERISDNDMLPNLTPENFVTSLLEEDKYIVIQTLLPDICPVSALFDMEGNLIMNLDVDNYLSGEMLEEFERTFEKKNLVLQWNGHSFE